MAGRRHRPEHRNHPRTVMYGGTALDARRPSACSTSTSSRAYKRLRRRGRAITAGRVSRTGRSHAVWRPAAGDHTRRSRGVGRCLRRATTRRSNSVSIFSGGGAASDLPPCGHYGESFTRSAAASLCRSHRLGRKVRDADPRGSRRRAVDLVPKEPCNLSNLSASGEPGQQWPEEAVVLVVVGAELPDTVEVPLVEHPA